MTRLLTDGGIPLLAMHNMAPILSRSARDIENEDPLMLGTKQNYDRQNTTEKIFRLFLRAHHMVCTQCYMEQLRQRMYNDNE